MAQAIRLFPRIVANLHLSLRKSATKPVKTVANLRQNLKNLCISRPLPKNPVPEKPAQGGIFHKHGQCLKKIRALQYAFAYARFFSLA